MKRLKAEIIRFMAFDLKHTYTEEDGSSDTAKLTWSKRNGYPRITVWLSSKNNGEKLDYGKIIIAPFDIITAHNILSRLNEVMLSKEDKVYKIGAYNNIYVDNERTDEIKLVATIEVGKHRGVMYFKVIESGKKVVKFEILPSAYTKYYDKQGDLITDRGILSAIQTRAYINRLSLALGEKLGKASTPTDTM